MIIGMRLQKKKGCVGGIIKQGMVYGGRYVIAYCLLEFVGEWLMNYFVAKNFVNDELHPLRIDSCFI